MITRKTNPMRKKIESKLTEGFERRLLQAAFRNLEDSTNPLCFNNFAYAIRELIRHILSRNAPDDEVRSCSWYVNETEKNGGITRKQRVFYAVQGGLSDVYVVDVLSLDIMKVHRTLRDALDNLSKYTHVEESTFAIDVAHINRFVDETLNAIILFFSAIEENQNMLVSALWEQIDNSVINAALSETIQVIDELSTHHSIEEVDTNEIVITCINSHVIIFKAQGTIYCELQWGSNSDLHRGDGAIIEESFPFECELWSSVDDPQSVQVDEASICVDTSSWFE
jgi:hypothetical protein